MEPTISDSTTGARLRGLERFIDRYVGNRQPGFGATADNVNSIEMTLPLQRFFGFAGRWPGQNPQTPNANRVCMQHSRVQFKASPEESPTTRTRHPLPLYNPSP